MRLTMENCVTGECESTGVFDKSEDIREDIVEEGIEFLGFALVFHNPAVKIGSSDEDLPPYPK